MEDEGRNQDDGHVHLALRVDEKVKGILFGEAYAAVVRAFAHEEKDGGVAPHDPFPEKSCLVRIREMSLPEVVAQETEEKTQGTPGRKPEEESEIERGVRGVQTGLPQALVQEEEI
jgi:hypothetical protein